MTTETLNPVPSLPAQVAGGSIASSQHAARRAVPLAAAALAFAAAGGAAAATVSRGRPSALSVPPDTHENVGSPEALQAEMAPMPTELTRAQASRFLSQAAFGGVHGEIFRVRQMGISSWLDAEFAKPQGATYRELMGPGGLDYEGVAPEVDGAAADGRLAVQAAMWRKMISFPDVLRQRVTLALSELFVMNAVVATPMRGYKVGTYMDVLEKHAFGNYRDLLLGVATSSAMGSYLSHKNNRKADPVTGASPDENFARELLQLFTIGTVKLNLDGTPVLGADRQPIDAYKGSDVGGLARVMTGWVDAGDGQPMRMNERYHESGAKTFLGYTIPAGTAGVASMEAAIDFLMGHPNIAPFVAKQLIQRFATSNPGPRYVETVAKAFRDTKGDMKSVLRAIFTWRGNISDVTLTLERRGKLREPMVRLIHWARAFKVQPNKDKATRITNLTGALAQSPLCAPSIFNFFRPGYVPPATSELGQRGMKAPEVQITNETSVANYVNFMQLVSANKNPRFQADYSAWLPLAQNPAALVAELNVVIAAGQLSAATTALITQAVTSINPTSPDAANRRVHLAVLFVFVAPEYVQQK